MTLYEHIFIARPELTQHQIEHLVEGYKEILEGFGGRVGRIEHWGLRNLAYRIKKNRKAYYVLMDIEAPHEAIKELERQMRISEDILRYMTVKVEEHEKGPSAVLARRDRDDRNYRENDKTRSVRKSSEEQTSERF